jgi:lipoprotein-anchoring transpeptidase ErfK/SrfK
MVSATGSRATRRLGVLTAVMVAALGVPSATAAEPAGELLPVNGFDPLVRLSPGDTGPSVEVLQQGLIDAGFYRRPVDGIYGSETEMAVLAFHKYVGLERTTSWNGLDWIRLRLLPDPRIPNRHDEPDRVEVDIGRQLIFIIRDHEIAGVLHTSTGGAYTYFSERNGTYVRAGTPRGDYSLRWRQYGWVCDRTTGWCVYKYWAFSDFYGIHGYLDVPSFPASHGCVRINTWDADWLDDRLFVGMPVHIWDEPPEIAPPPPPPHQPDDAGAVAV